MGNLKAYIGLLKEQTKKFPNTSVWGLLKYCKRWMNSLSDDNNNNELPWMTFGAIDFLNKHANEHMHIFEYGSGSSTLFWAKRVKHVISVEHDLAWSKKVKSDIEKNRISNVHLQYIPPVKRTDDIALNPADPYQYSTDDEQWKNYSFENYVRAIESYPDNSFDFVIVDGRSRPSCIAAALQKIKIGGYLVVDNSERQYYFTGTNAMLAKDNWQRTDFCGPVPGLRHFHQTSFFKKLK